MAKLIGVGHHSVEHVVAPMNVEVRIVGVALKLIVDCVAEYLEVAWVIAQPDIPVYPQFFAEISLQGQIEDWDPYGQTYNEYHEKYSILDYEACDTPLDLYQVHDEWLS